MAFEIKKMAVFVGCTYAGTEVELEGPIKDVSRMRDLIIERFGFQASDIEFLTDAPGSSAMPTGVNIRLALKRMFKRAEAGDVLFFHFSGHATRVPIFLGDGEYEAIVPSDFNLILDAELRELMSCLPEGASFTFLSDSCLTHGFIDIKKDMIEPYSVSTPIINRIYESKTMPHYPVSGCCRNTRDNLHSTCSPPPVLPGFIYHKTIPCNVITTSPFPCSNDDGVKIRFLVPNIPLPPPHPIGGHRRYIAPPPSPPPPTLPRWGYTEYMIFPFTPSPPPLIQPPLPPPRPIGGNTRYIAPASCPPPPPLPTLCPRRIRQAIQTTPQPPPIPHTEKTICIDTRSPPPTPPPRPIGGNTKYIAPGPSPPPPPLPRMRNTKNMIPTPPPPPPYHGNTPNTAPLYCKLLKYIPHELILLKLIKSVTNQDASDDIIGELMRAHFGEDASPIFSTV